MRLFKNVDLHAELDKLADRGEQERLLTEAMDHLSHIVADEKLLESSLSLPQKPITNINVAELDDNRIYTEDQIRSLSIRFRLRFLCSDLFRSAIPAEALFEMRRLQDQLKVPLSGFKVLAPAKLFRLHDCNEDPLLFLTLPDGTYYLVHKWGNDLAWYRELLFLPFRNIHTMILSVFSVALSIGLLFPESWFVGVPEGAYLAMRGFLTMYSFIAISGLTILFAFAFSKNLNSGSWDSRFFN